MHNQTSDILADDGIIEGYFVGVDELARHFHQIRNELLEAVVKLQKAMLRSLKAEAELRKQEDEEKATEAKALYGKDASKVKIPATLHNSIGWNAENAMAVELADVKPSEIKGTNQLLIFMVYVFIKHSRWVPTSGSDNGISSLELFATFNLMGGRTECPDTKDQCLDENEQLIPA